MFRAFAQYTPTQAAVRCREITLAEFSERVLTHQHASPSAITRFKNLIAQTEACGQSAHLVEWDDGLIVLILSPYPKNSGELTCYTLSAAYCYAVSTGDFFFIDVAGPK